LETTKIISRTRTGLQSIFDETFGRILVELMTKPDQDTRVVLEALRCMLNMCVLARQAALGNLVKAGAHTALVQVHTAHKTNRDITYVVLRLWFFIVLDKPAALTLVNEHDLYTVLIHALAAESTANLNEQKLDTAEGGNLNRCILAEALKVIFNLHLDKAVPRVHTVVSKDDFTTLANTFSTILAYGVEVTQTDLDEITRIKERLPGLTEALPSPSDGKTTSAACSAVLVMLDAKVDGEWIRPIFAEHSDPAERVLAQTTLSKLKTHTLMLLMYLTPQLELAFLQDLRAFKVFVYTFHRTMLMNPRVDSDRMIPMLMVAHKLASLSKLSNTLLKNHIFGPVAYKRIIAEQKEGEQKAICPEDMTELQYRTERNPYRLRTILQNMVTSFRDNIKVSVSELLYTLCADDTAEYIRLVGFGAGVGLLQRKGAQGFGNILTQTVDLGEVARSIRAEEQKGLSTEEAKAAVTARLMNPTAARTPAATVTEAKTATATATATVTATVTAPPAANPNSDENST
jgi:hypothetical protein